MNDIIKGMAMGHLISSDGGAAQRGAAVAEAREQEAERGHQTAMLLAMELGRTRQEASDWRNRARNLSANLKARKMSEATLLEALQQENANHPLATREAVDLIVDKVIEEEDKLLRADPVAYADEIAQRMPIATDEELEAEEAARQAAEAARIVAERQARLDPVEQPFLAQMPADIRALTPEQRAEKAKKANEDISLGFAKELPAWVAIEMQRREAVKQSDQMAAQAEAAEAARIAAQLTPEEQAVADHQARIRAIEQPFLAQMPEDIRSLTEEQRTARIKKSSEDISLGFAKEIPAWVAVEMQRREAVKLAEASEEEAPAAPRC